MDRYPHGAIAPVTYIWRPESKAGEDAERRIWLWVHAAAFEEALACLQNLCRTQVLYVFKYTYWSISHLKERQEMKYYVTRIVFIIVSTRFGFVDCKYLSYIGYVAVSIRQGLSDFFVLSFNGLSSSR